MKPTGPRILILILTLLSRWGAAQPVVEPEVRWLAGGAIAGPIQWISFSADSSTVFTYGAYYDILGLKSWDFASRQLLSLTLPPTEAVHGPDGPDNPIRVVVSHDGRHVAFMSDRPRMLFLCRIDDGSVIWSLPGTTVWGISGGIFSLDDELLLGRGGDGRLEVLRTRDGKGIGTPFVDDFRWAEFISETEFLAGTAGVVARYDAETGNPVWKNLDPALPWGAIVSPDGSEFCVPTTNGIRRYSTEDGQMIADVALPPGSVTYSPDGATLAIERYNIGIELRDLTNGTLQRTLANPQGASRITWSPDGEHLLASTTYHTYEWSVNGDTNGQPFFPFTNWGPGPAKLSSDGQWVVESSYSKEVVLLNATNGTVAYRWPLESDVFVQWAYPSPATNVLFLPGWGNGDLEIRALPEGTLLNTVTLFTNAVYWSMELDVSADGSRLLASDWEGARFAVFSTRTWEVIREGTNQQWGSDARITPDGARVLMSDESTTLVWTVDDDSPPIVIPRGGDLEFGTEPDEVWTLDPHGWIDLWRITDGSRLGGSKIPVTNDWGSAAVFSPDRRLILASQRDPGPFVPRPLEVWRTDNGELVGQIGGPAAIHLLHFTSAPDGRWVMAKRADGSLLAFDFPFFVQDPVVDNEQLHLEVVGAPGPFQLESRPLLDANWTEVGEPFSNEISLSVEGEPASLYRARRP